MQSQGVPKTTTQQNNNKIDLNQVKPPARKIPEEDIMNQTGPLSIKAT